MSDTEQRRRGRPYADQPVFNRQAFLDMALKAFAEQGYEGVAIRQLARDYGVSHQLIHHHFKSKLQLWQEAITAAAEHTYVDEPRGLTSPDESSALQRFRNAIMELVVGASEHPEVYKILADEMSKDSPRFAYLFDNYTGRNVELATQVLKQAEVEGDARNIDPITVHLMVIFLSTSIPEIKQIVRSYNDRLGKKSTKAPEEYAAEMMDIVIEGIRSR